MSHVLVMGGWNHPADKHMRIVRSLARANPSITQIDCLSPDALGSALSHVPQPIDLLDIFFHGGPGQMCLGREADEPRVLFASDAGDSALVGSSYARELDRYLTPTAHVRLLGCRTALRRSGRRLLVELARALRKQRTVWGTIGSFDHTDFDMGELTAIELLYSSLQAHDSGAPDITTREQSWIGHSADTTEPGCEVASPVRTVVAPSHGGETQR